MGVDSLVDEHLHGDAAVGEKRGRHARRDRRLVDRGAELQLVEVHLPVVEPEEIPIPRVTHVELGRRRQRRATDEIRIGLAVTERTRLRRCHLDPGGRSVVEAPGVRDADGHDPACAGSEDDAAAVEVEHRHALEHIEALLERVNVHLDVAVLEAAEPETHVHRPAGAVDERRTREALAP